MSKRFKKLLTNISQESMQKQREMLDSEINNWMDGNKNEKKMHKQIDDILVIGIKVT